MSGFTDRNGRKVPKYSQNRRAAQGRAGRMTWTGSPSRPKPKPTGPKTNGAGQWKNVKQQFVLPRGKPKPAKSWLDKEHRDRRPGQLAMSGSVTSIGGALIVATTSGLTMLVGAVVLLCGSAFFAWSLVLKAGVAAKAEPPLCPRHGTGYNPTCKTCRSRYAPGGRSK